MSHIYLTLSMHPYLHCIVQMLSTYEQLRKVNVEWNCDYYCELHKYIILLFSSIIILILLFYYFLLLLRNRLSLWLNFTSALHLLIEILIKKLNVYINNSYVYTVANFWNLFLKFIAGYIFSQSKTCLMFI